MGLFDKIFKSEREIAKEEIVEVPWKLLTSEEQLNEIETRSKEKTIVIFKHSTRCGISKMVLRSFEKEYEPSGDVELYFLDLIENRGLSNSIAEKFSVRHESPQMIIVKDSLVVHYASHPDISAGKINEYI